MANDIDALCKALKDFSIAVAVDHLAAVPKCVVVILAVVHRRIEAQPLVVDRVSVADCFIKIVDIAAVIVGFVYCSIFYRFTTFASDACAGKRFGAMGVVNGAAFCSGDRVNRQQAGNISLAADARRQSQGLHRPRALLFFSPLNDIVQDVRRNDLTNRKRL